VKAAVYLRVSTDDQDEEHQGPDCLRLVEARGWEPLVFQERESGAVDRPVWREVLELARRGEVRAVVVRDLKRYGRRRLQILEDVAKLDEWGCTVVSIREPWLEAFGRARELLLGIFAWWAEDERLELIQATRSGLARARRKGKILGRPAREFTDDAKKLAQRLRGEGRSWRKVAAELRSLELGDFDPAIVRRAVLKGSAVGPN
jgi:DNA invertase Pin-like site-specific DNA recombinase